MVPAFFFAVLSTSGAQAWERHETLMPGALVGLPESVQNLLQRRFPPPCGITDNEVYARLATELGLQPAALVLPTSPEACARRLDLSPRDILLGPATDDPDLGMDRDLSAAFDPSGDRRTMGGETGPASQGFRHMYFGGWSPLKPLATFQVPPRAQGQAPERAELIALKARQLIRSGDVLWGFRVLGWAMHYVQDLSQPFHAAQIPNLRMVPWYVALRWPPREAYSDLVRETTRSIANFHRGYEGYVLQRIREGNTSPFADCLKNPAAYATLTYDHRRQSPRELALEVSESSITRARETGAAVLELLGGHLRGPAFDLANGKGTLDFADLAIRPDLMNQRVRLEKVTCQSLAVAAMASQRLIGWAIAQ